MPDLFTIRHRTTNGKNVATEEAIDLTILMLQECKAIGFEIVTIGYGDDDNPTSNRWPSAPMSVFAWTSDAYDTGVCQRLWDIRKKMPGEFAGCCNGYQMQLHHHHTLIHCTFFVGNMTDEEISDALWAELVLGAL